MEINPKPFKVMHPGFEVANELEARGWTQQELATIIGRPLITVNQIINGRRAITPETALQLSAALGSSAAMWLKMEANYRLWLAEQSLGESLASIAKRARNAEEKHGQAS